MEITKEMLIGELIRKKPEALYNNAAFANSFQRKMYDIYKVIIE